MSNKNEDIKIVIDKLVKKSEKSSNLFNLILSKIEQLINEKEILISKKTNTNSNQKPK